MTFRFSTAGRRLEVEWDGPYGHFFVRLPLLGEILYSPVEGWRRWPWDEVKAQLQREQAKQREAQEHLEAQDQNAVQALAGSEGRQPAAA